MDNNTISDYQLGTHNRCTFRRKHNITTKTQKNDQYYKSVAIKQTLKDAMKNDWDEDRILQELEKNFSALTEYPTHETARIHAVDAKNQVMRYLTSEHRVPIDAEAKTLDIFGVSVSVNPDFIFVEGDNIEVVKLCCSKPRITQTGKKKDVGAKYSLSLYALYCYGKTLVPSGTVKNVKASYYYLRKDNDSVAENRFDPDFFNLKGGKNIVSLACETDGITPNELDNDFEPQFEEYKRGEEVSGSTCEGCDFFHLCNYKFSPKCIERVKEVKTAKDLMLTPSQMEAIDFEKGLCRINAGAGAGKTLVVALRTVTLFEKGVKPEEICLLTFTNTGAEEMRERIRLYNEDFGTEADVTKLVSTTFNAFGNEIVKKEYESLGFSAPPQLIDDVERAGIIADLLRNTVIPGIDYRNFDFNSPTCRGALAMTKRMLYLIKTYGLYFGDEETLYEKLGNNRRFVKRESLTPMIELSEKYDEVLKKNNLIEYADQERMVFEILRQNPFYLEDFGFKHIIIDEFQDSNEGQIALIKELVNCPTFESLMVVGDDSQSIFSFRDTTPENILHFFEFMGEEGDDFYLVENHRSTPEIIEMANKINSLNEHRIVKDLVATRPSGKKPIVKGFHKKQDEIDYVVSEIKNKIDNGTKPEDIAFIASKKTELLTYGSALTEAGIPWVMINPEPLLENSRVIAALEFMKAYANPESTQSLLIYLNCFYKNQLLERYSDDDIDELITKTGADIARIKTMNSIEQFNVICNVLQDLDDDDEVYESFIDVLKSKGDIERIISYCQDFEKYGTGNEVKRVKTYPGVVLTTAHSSKGMEWPIVFNSITCYDTKELHTSGWSAIEEKRRLLFVSITRARDELYVTGQYIAFGDKTNRSYNMFLKECYEAIGKEFVPYNPEEAAS